MDGIPPARRPEKAVLMAELRRMGVEFSAADTGANLHQLLLASQPDPLDHDGDGKKGGSKPGRRTRKAG